MKSLLKKNKDDKKRFGVEEEKERENAEGGLSPNIHGGKLTSVELKKSPSSKRLIPRPPKDSKRSFMVSKEK